MAAITFLYTRFKITSDLDKRISILEKEDVSEKFRCLSEDVREIKVKNNLIWGAVEKSMVELLHHPTEYERDTLLEKLRDKTITLQEIENLEGILEKAITLKKGEPEGMAASLLLAALHIRVYDSTIALKALNKCGV
jgi:phosphoenolpyruvate carboxylase